jgi:uncharacterized protein
MTSGSAMNRGVLVLIRPASECKMTRSMRPLHLLLFAIVWCGACSQRETDYTIDAVPHSQVDITDEFWAPKIEVNRTVSIQHLFKKYEELGRFDTPRAIEAAAYMLAKRPDAELERYVDGLIDKAVANVESRASDPERVVRVSGNFFEAAVAYYQATGKKKMLDAAIKAADAMDAAYGPGKKTYISGHEGLKIGLISLYRQTGDERYWKLAQFFLDERGKDEYPRTGEYAIDRTYAQDHAPVIRQNEALGHAVRATYLYVPLADITALTRRPEYQTALNRIWEDATYHKTYITGGVGSIRFHEQFGAAYELPNLSAWNETCASYGYILWNQRMFQLQEDAGYIDQLERVLYNGFLDGVSARGDRFFYQNPLTSYGNYERFDWINTPCCPPNVVRLIASLGNYIYATARQDDDIYVNLFVGSTATIPIGPKPANAPDQRSRVTIRQDTRYPWDGRVKLAVDPDRAQRFAMHIRIPGWTGTRVMPGDLYRFMDNGGEPAVVKVNGQMITPSIVKGFARIDRQWSKGDSIELTLPMPVRKILANDRVKEDEGRVALQRGPLVYAAEWPDNDGHALNLIVPDDARLTSEYRRDLLNGITVVTGRVQALTRGSDGSTAQPVPHRLVAIPYYAWANRGPGEMQVWMARRPDVARVSPVALPDAVAKVSSSGGIEKKWTGYNDQNDDIAAVYDNVTPLSSADESHLYFRMRPPVGQPAWVEYEFKQPTTISTAEAYWADDRRFCKLPSSWRVTYKAGGEWRPVVHRGTYGVAKDTFNRVEFDPVTTTAVRLEVEPRTVHYKSGEIGPPEAMFLDKDMDWREFGLIEWRVR